ncbi:hypothetical protein [Streptomyces viridosporus]|nr:hypothetical protein [Streptomyces viridosporus]
MGNDLGRLATLVKERRLELGLGVEPAAKLTGMSKDTWKKVEAAQTVRATSYTNIERALQWAPGSCRRILAGGDPVATEALSSAPSKSLALIPRDELERQVGDAINRAALGVKSDLTAEQILELNERVLDELRKRGVL